MQGANESVPRAVAVILRGVRHSCLRAAKCPGLSVSQTACCVHPLDVSHLAENARAVGRSLLEQPPVNGRRLRRAPRQPLGNHFATTVALPGWSVVMNADKPTYAVIGVQCCFRSHNTPTDAIPSVDLNA